MLSQWIQSGVKRGASDLLVEAGRSDEAEREARRALELAPRHPRALEILDDLYTRAGRLADLEPVLSQRAEADVDPYESEVVHRFLTLPRPRTYAPLSSTQ